MRQQNLKNPKSANVVLFNYDENDIELGASAEEKGKIDSKVWTVNNDKYNEVLCSNTIFFDMTVNDFVRFKVHEYNQPPWESFLCRYDDLAND